MKAIHLEINKEECCDLAERLFFEMSGIDRKGDKFERMKEGARRMRELVEDRIDIKVKCIFYGGSDVELNNNGAVIGGEMFLCKAFEQIIPGHVKGAYVYALTAGEYDFAGEAILNRLYSDIWGTAFTDAARELLERELSRIDMISDGFGPGFYGMPASEMMKIDRLLNFVDIGVELKNNRILTPVKSCCGMFFSVTEGYERIDNACGDCTGSEKSCILCRKISCVT